MTAQAAAEAEAVASPHAAKASQCPHIQLLDQKLFQGGPPRTLYRELRENFPVCWLDDPHTDTGYWAVTRQAPLDIISKNPKIFSSEIKTPMLNELEPEDIRLQSNTLISMDPPRHIKYRNIVRKAFTPRAIMEYRPHFEEVIQGVLDKFVSTGKCEFVSAIACELPLIAICEILGVPIEDRQTFFKWSNTLIGGDDPDYCHTREEQQEALASLFMYADKLLAQYRDKPPPGIVGVLLKGTVEGERLNEDEFRHFMLLLIVAGNETTRNQTSHLLRLLIENPQQYEMLVQDPSLIPDAVLEALRYNSPVIAFRRTAMADAELEGQHIKAGDKMVLFYQSASSDESNFQDPDVFDITRPRREPVAEKLRAFGIGEHYCLGTHLARLQLNVVLEALVKNIRKPRFDGEVKWLHSFFINGIKEMPIRFEAA